MAKSKESVAFETDQALDSVPMNQRQHWTTPAIIFGGLEFTVPVIMVGATIIGGFSLINVFWILIVSLIIQWIGNFLIGYMGAKTGSASSVIARSSFGSKQARFVIGLVIFVVSLGWWAIQTAVAGEAIAAMLGVDYTNEWFLWALITVVIGLIFAAPSIIGYSSMKWTDYLAVPAGVALIVAALAYAFKDIGVTNILNWNPDSDMKITSAINLVLGANVAQWLIAADYTRYAKPKKKDNILIPLGIIAIGFPLFLVGAVMSVGVGEPDIVNVMTSLGFPFWGFLILWLVTYTSQLVNNYSMGLAFSNLMNVNSGKGRAYLTFIGTLIAIVLALIGILDYFEAFLNFSAIIYAATAGILFTDFYLIRKFQWSNNEGWNWMATLALIIGVITGAISEFNTFGIPAIQTLIIGGIVYYFLMKWKANNFPDHFTKNIT